MSIYYRFGVLVGSGIGGVELFEENCNKFTAAGGGGKGLKKVRIFISLYMYVCMDRNMYIYMCTYVYLYICMSVCIYIYKRIA